MRFSFTRIDGKLYLFVDFKRELFGLSYPVFHRGIFRFLISMFVPRLRRRYFSPPSLQDLAYSKCLHDWYDSLPPDPTTPLHDILDS